MKRLPIFGLALLLAACGKPESGSSKQVVSKNPVSVRGWIADVEGSGAGGVRTIETEMARRAELFQSTTVWVENAPYVSGGVAENGAFILLDVPPGDVIITFTAPGAANARLTLNGIPGNADVLIPGLLLKPNAVTVLKPEAIRVRVPAKISAPRPTGANATIAGHQVPVSETPLGAFVDRRDYPEPEGLRTVATYK